MVFAGAGRGWVVPSSPHHSLLVVGPQFGAQFSTVQPPSPLCPPRILVPPAGTPVTRDHACPALPVCTAPGSQFGAQWSPLRQVRPSSPGPWIPWNIARGTPSPAGPGCGSWRWLTGAERRTLADAGVAACVQAVTAGASARRFLINLVQTTPLLPGAERRSPMWTWTRAAAPGVRQSHKQRERGPGNTKVGGYGG